MKRLEVSVGSKFDELTVVKEIEPVNGLRKFECVCSCGTPKTVLLKVLRRDGHKSCGCYRLAKSAERFRGNQYGRRYGSMAERRSKWIFRHRYGDGDLTFAQFYNLSQCVCRYCGNDPSNNDSGFIYNGLDRIDSSRPHDYDNCVPCCSWCNLMKSDFSVAEFKEKIFRIHNQFNKEGSA